SGGARDDGHARCVDRHRAAHRESRVLGGVRAAGHDHQFVDARRPGDDGLGAADDDAVGAPFLHVDVHVRVALAAGSLGAVALGVGHRDCNGQVLLLYPVHVLHEPLVVGAAVGLVGAPRGLVQGGEGVVGEITLGAAGYLAYQA